MKLQLALDTLDIEESLKCLKLIHEYVDIIEVGTPMLIQYGLSAVRAIKSNFPNHQVLADAKIIDAGEFEASLCFDANADIVTVLGVSNSVTIANVLNVSRQRNKKVMVDLIEVKDVHSKVIELDEMGVDYICVHTAYDIQSDKREPLDELQTVNKAVRFSKSAIAGGIKLLTIEEVIKNNPEIIVVGGGILNHPDPVFAAKTFYKRIKEV